MPLVRSEPGPVWRLTLDRPDARNAVSSAMLEDLRGALDEAAADPDGRVVVLAGEGSDFCAGADIAELEEAAGGPGGAEYGRAFEAVLTAIAEHPLPVLAAVHGAALGAGCQIAVASDLAVAAEDARIGIPSARLGILINLENIERLVLAVGPKRAADLLLTGRALSGTEAAAWALVNEAVPPASLDERVADVARTIAESAPLSVRGSKRGIRAVVAGRSVERTALAEEFDSLAAQAFASEDLREGLLAFRERRRPEFRGT